MAERARRYLFQLAGSLLVQLPVPNDATTESLRLGRTRPAPEGASGEIVAAASSYVVLEHRASQPLLRRAADRRGVLCQVDRPRRGVPRLQHLIPTPRVDLLAGLRNGWAPGHGFMHMLLLLGTLLVRASRLAVDGIRCVLCRQPQLVSGDAVGWL